MTKIVQLGVILAGVSLGISNKAMELVPENTSGRNAKYKELSKMLKVKEEGSVSIYEKQPKRSLATRAVAKIAAGAADLVTKIEQSRTQEARPDHRTITQKTQASKREEVKKRSNRWVTQSNKAKL